MSIPDLLVSGVERGVFPGAAAAWGTVGRADFAYAGRFTYDQSSPEVDASTLWDIASLTKVVAATSIAMVLWEKGELDLDQRVAEIEPRFKARHVRVRDLLLHRSGLPAYRHLENEAELFAEPVSDAIPAKTVYSCLGFIVLQRVLEKVGGRPLDALAQELVFGPLGMDKTGFNPTDKAHCAPTEDGLQGTVHDPNARMLGGVSGNAGLFSVAGDLALWCQALLGGERSIWKPETVSYWTRRWSPHSTRALGFDTKSPSGSSAGRLFHPKSYGHLGFTGTSAWMDPVLQGFAILLTNRVFPTSENLRIATFRPEFYSAAARKLREERP